MKPLWTKQLSTALLITSIMISLLVYLAACTPAALSSRGALTHITGAPDMPEAAATSAVQTIDAALLQTVTATLTPVPLAVHTEKREETVAATATLPPVQLPTPIIIIILPTASVNSTVEQNTPTATPDLTATAQAEDLRVATALAATQTAQPTATPDLVATATAETKRLAIAIAETLTAQPTATATSDLAATATAVAQWLAKALAATLTAQPTNTPTASATPDWAATKTAINQAMATAVAATLTAQPTATPVPTETPLPTATWTPAPTATATPDFKPLLVDYRRAERAALQSLDPNVLAQLPVFASGEALTAIHQQVEALRVAGQYQILMVEEIQIVQVMLGPTIGVLTHERHTQQTFTRTADGDRLLAQETVTLNVVYGISDEAGRWKINRVRIVNAA